jgi:hypothetical protein
MWSKIISMVSHHRIFRNFRTGLPDVIFSNKNETAVVSVLCLHFVYGLAFFGAPILMNAVC